MTGYDFHPEAAIDLDEIWEFIAEDNIAAADKVIADILAAIDVLVVFPHRCVPAPLCSRTNGIAAPI